MATATKTARTVFSSAANTAGSTSRGRLSLTTALGGLLTIKMTNGGTGPTVGCTCNVLVAHNASQPTAASANTDWKTLTSFTHVTTNSAIGEWAIDIPDAAMQLEVEFTGNTGQSVTCEAGFSELTSIQ